MQKNYFFSLSFSLLLALALPSYAVLEIPNTQPKVGAEVWKPILDKTWEGIKKRNIQPYGTGLIHRPKSETPGDAVSEGVGYGMILALYANDQKTFNQIWDASEKYMFNNNAKIYDWRNQSIPHRTWPATMQINNVLCSFLPINCLKGYGEVC